MLTLVDDEYTTVFIVFVALIALMIFLYGKIESWDDEE